MAEENIRLNFRLKNKWNKKLFHWRNKAKLFDA